jgi:hypothetical protein
MLKLAFTAKWISGLFLSLLLAVGFALLAQWQVSRAVVPNSGKVEAYAVGIQKLEANAKPGAAFTFNELKTSGSMGFLTELETKVVLSPARTVVIADRFQADGTKGYWFVMPGNTSQGNIFVVVGFLENKNATEIALAKIRTLPDVATDITGRYLPSEEPVELNPDGTYASLAIAQLINDLSWKTQQPKTYAGFLADTSKNSFVTSSDLKQLNIDLSKTDGQVNWLSSFYAIEWTFFAGFAVFIWWRLLADSYRKQQEALLG